jgi:hypothetical protein
MTKSQALLVAAAFLLAAIGFYALTQRASAQAARACEQTCAAKGKSFIVLPAGSAGRYVDGTNTREDAANTCSCLER